MRVSRRSRRYAGPVPASQRSLPDGLRKAAETFEDYLRIERGASPRTIEAYRRDIRRYLTNLAAARVREVNDATAADVVRFLDACAQRGAAGSTINRTLAAVRHFHRFCVREGIAAQNPASLVDGPARGLSLPKALTPEVVERIIEAAAGSSPAQLRDRAMLELLYGAGLRVSELVRLDVDDVDLDDRTVRCIGKGDKERVVPIGEPGAAAVRRYLRQGRGELATAGRLTHALFLRVGGGLPPAKLQGKDRWGFALVALAGPVSNLVLAFIAAVALSRLYAVDVKIDPVVIDRGAIALFGAGRFILSAAFVWNVLLAAFNLLPIPPLDGSRLIRVFLSADGRRTLDRIEPYGFLILFALIIWLSEPLSRVIQLISSGLLRIMPL